MSRISQLVDVLYDKFESKKNKKNSITRTDSDDDKKYYLSIYGLKSKLNEIAHLIDTKQDKLVGKGADQNIKTINNNNILGTGNIEISEGTGSQKQVDWAVNDEYDVRFIKHKPPIEDYTTLEDVESCINDYLKGITKFRVKIIEELPEPSIAERDVIYFIKNKEEIMEDVYDEYLISENQEWLHLGTNKVNLDDYLTKEEWNHLRKYYVHVEEGKGLSDENFTSQMKKQVSLILPMHEDIIALGNAINSNRTQLDLRITEVEAGIYFEMKYKADKSYVDDSISDLVRGVEDAYEDKIIFELDIQRRIKNALISKFAKKEHYHDIIHLKDEYHVLDKKQDILIDIPTTEGDTPNIKTINGQSILGEGNLIIGDGGKIQSDWSQTDNTQPDYIKSKPDLNEYLTKNEYNSLIEKQLNELKEQIEQKYYDKTTINTYLNMINDKIQKIYKEYQPKLKDKENIAVLNVNGKDKSLTNGGVIVIPAGGGGGGQQVQVDWNLTPETTDPNDPRLILNRPTDLESVINKVDTIEGYSESHEKYLSIKGIEAYIQNISGNDTPYPVEKGDDTLYPVREE